MVCSPWDEFSLRLDLFVKEAARQTMKGDDAHTGMLVHLFCEEDLKPTKALSKRVIDASLLSALNSCRSSANSQLNVSRQSTSEHVVQFLDDNEEVLCLVDPSFRVEAAWFRHMASSGCKQILEEAMLAELPDKAELVDIGDKAIRFNRIKSTTSYNFADKESQASVNVVTEWVKALASLRRPSFLAAKDNDFLKQVQLRMKHLLRVNVPGAGPDEEEKVLVGDAAMQHCIAAMTARVAKGETIRIGDLQLFDTYNWMMAEEQLGLHNGWVKATFQAASSTTVVSTASSSPAPPTTSEGAAPLKKKRDAQELADTTMSLFKRKRATQDR